MSVFDSTERFLRPADVDGLRRNYRGVQLQSLLRAIRNATLIIAVAAGVALLYRHTQSDARFAVRRVEVTGAVHTSRDALRTLTRRYVGLNLFRLDIDRVGHDLTSLDWVSRIEIEKALPDTLRIRVVERIPVALTSRDGVLRYVDENGKAFAELSPSAGDSDLPMIVASNAADTARGVTLLRELRLRDAAVYTRISEVRPLLPRGFALFDREFGATVYAEEEDLSMKWRDYFAVASAEHFRRGDIEYADLRFADRIVMKPVRLILGPPVPVPRAVPTLITN